MTTFQLSVQIDDETKTYMTGAEHQGEAASALATFLKADIKDINILRIAPKSKIIFVPCLNATIETPSLTPEELEEGMMPDEDPDKDVGF